MKTLGLTLSLILSSLTFSYNIARADLPADFQTMLDQRKGPFGPNVSQGSQGQASYDASPKGHLFTSAFRNDQARVLIDQYGMYTGNLFTTNYYELNSEFVFGNALSTNHGIDNEALMAIASVAMPRAVQMVKSWVLEKYYVEIYPDSKLARSFALRGISGTEFEMKFAGYFFNFYMSSINDDYQYLPVFLLAKESPISDSSELSEARNLVTQVYDFFSGLYGTNDARVLEMYKIRNIIHNQLSEDVIGRIERFLRENPWYEKDGHTYLQRINVLLRKYYNFTPENLKSLAKASSAANVEAAAQSIIDQGITAETLLQLSQVTADLKTSISTSAVAWEKKASTLALITKSCQFINKEINRMSAVTSVAAYQAMLNTIYSEGFLIQDNWLYYQGELSTIEKAKATMPEVIEVATMTLQEAFTGSLEQWISIAPDGKLEMFIDNTIKSSSLNTAALSLTK